ncbi:MAG: molybdopterin molybdotransferase MoeA [Candidatus Dormibacteraeota bacterium]|nr:molybdopterin molybdotransferase MoeA [Candidatus Dormibacteraeota bacterium]
MRASTYALMDAGAAAALVLERTPVLGLEELPLAECAGRVLGADLVAHDLLPRFPASAVDGYALRSADGGGRLWVAGESAAGRPFEGVLPAGSATRILTGGVLPEGADSVVMVEDVEAGPDWVTVPDRYPSGRNFHAPGADLQAGELILPQGLPLGPAELGLAAAVGCARLAVFRRPRVALMSTGDELVEVGETPGPGQIVDSNRWALNAALVEAGVAVTRLGVAPDRPAPLRELVEHALAEHDVLVTSGGVSVGTHDLVKPLLEDLGQVHIGRVRLRPGKPFTFATLPAGRLAFGLPGFPVSSLVTFEVFVRPALRRMQGHRFLQRPTLPVRLGYEAKAAGDRTEYQRVTLRREGAELVAETTGSQSSSRLMSLTGAHALVRVAPGNDGIAAGTVVDAIILSLPAAE